MIESGERAGKRGLGPVIVNGETMAWGRGARAGDFVFFAGSEGYFDASGERNTDLKSQTERALDQAKEWLAEEGLGFSDVVRMNQYLSDRALRSEFMSIRDSWLERNAPRMPEGASLCVDSRHPGTGL